ncbi:hypothetical protein BGX26_012965 [Mortierella sp. AD094]|nr:hypothetical protein BGX26_012965 [Mortierella sp. AD094]
MSSIDSVGDLIMEICTPARFGDIAPETLQLWLGPSTHKLESIRNNLAFLQEVIKTTEKLDELADISEQFEQTPPDGKVYVIVKRPQQGTAATTATTTTTATSVSHDKINPELMDIIATARKSHQPHRVEAASVEKYQRRALGRFFKNTLPYGQTATDLNLAMFGRVLDMQPTATIEDSRTLLDIVRDDVGKTTGHWVVALVGRSGSGKAATVVDLVQHHFIIYVVCSDPNSLTARLSGSKLQQLAQEVNAFYNKLQTPTSFQQVLDNDSMLKDLVADRVDLEFLARLLFLLMILEMDKNLTPEEFFRAQMSGGISTIGNLVNALRVYDVMTIRMMLQRVQSKVAMSIGNRGLVIAIDEAQIAEEYILPDREQEITNAKLMLKREFRRGFLTPLCATLSKMRATLVVLGTSLSLANADHVYTAIGKPDNFLRIVNFPSVDQDLVEETLNRTLDLEGCVIDPVKR